MSDFLGDGSLGEGVDPVSERYKGVVRLSQVRIRILRKSTKTTVLVDLVRCTRFDILKLTNVLKLIESFERNCQIIHETQKDLFSFLKVEMSLN